MKNYFKILILTISILIYGCSSDDGGNNGGGQGGIIAQATYSVTFEPEFTSETHPTDYPANAGFEKMVLVAHGSSTNVFNLGQTASDGLKNYVENGVTTGLEAELFSTEANPTTVVIGNDISANGTDSATITITPSTTRVSFISRISPSPDWFVGISSESFLESDNSLVESIGFRLYPIDGGTDSGTTYTSDDAPEIGPIQTILGMPFVDAMTGEVPSLGVINFVKIE